MPADRGIYINMFPVLPFRVAEEGKALKVTEIAQGPLTREMLDTNVSRVTRSIEKIIFKVPTKILPIYERSPYYIGSKLWNDLPKSIQEANDVYAFKKEIRHLNRTYIKL